MAAGRTANRLTKLIASETLPRNFPASKLVTPQQVIFKAADGLDIHGQIFLPPRREAGMTNFRR